MRADCCAAATFLAEQGLVDRKRMVIAGGSAGGFTTLACLAFRYRVSAIALFLYPTRVRSYSVDCLGIAVHSWVSNALRQLCCYQPNRSRACLPDGIACMMQKAVPMAAGQTLVRGDAGTSSLRAQATTALPTASCWLRCVCNPNPNPRSLRQAPLLQRCALC